MDLATNLSVCAHKHSPFFSVAAAHCFNKGLDYKWSLDIFIRSFRNADICMEAGAVVFDWQKNSGEVLFLVCVKLLQV